MNILNTIRDQLSPDVVTQISKSVGESPEGTRSALEQSVPALLGSAASEASSPSGAGGLFETLTRATPKQGWPASAASLLSGMGPGGGGLGSSIVSSLLGSKTSLVRDFISSRAGVRPESSSSVLGIAGSILASVLGRQITSQRLDAGGLGQLLKSQIPHLGGMSPDLTRILGIGNIFGTTQQPTGASYATPAYSTSQTTYREPVREPTPAYETVRPAAAAPSGARAFRWALIPLALLLGGLFLYRHARRPEMGGVREQTWTTTTGVLHAATNAVRGQQPWTTNINEGTSQTDMAFSEHVKDALSRGTGVPMDLHGISFDSAGNLTDEAKTRITNLGHMVGDYPAAKVSITAYGATADEAATKAASIKSALAATGVSADRISTQSEVGDALPKISFTK